MFTKKKILFLIIPLALFFAIQANSQIYNTEVEAKLFLETNNEFLKITATAKNKTTIDKSLRYVLSVFRTDDKGNRSKNDQEGRFTLEPNEINNKLSEITINNKEDNRLILLILLYDLDDNIVGKDRIVLNDDKPEEEVKNEISNSISENLYAQDVDTERKDGVVLSGIVIEETITKPGRDFYKMFYSDYSLNRINAEKVVTIKEIFALGTNTKIQVKVENDVLVEFFVRPQNDFLKSMSEKSIRVVSHYLQKLKENANIIKRY